MSMLTEGFAAGLMITQVLIAQPDWPNDKPAVGDHHPGQAVELSWRPVRGLSAEFICEHDCYARMFGHISFQVEGCANSHRDRAMFAAGLYVNGRRVWWSVGANVTQNAHYDDRPFATARVLEPGEHRVEVRTYWKPIKGRKSTCTGFHKRSGQSELIVEVLTR